MKKLLSMLLCLAVLLGVGAVAASALTREEAEEFAAKFNQVIAPFERKFEDRVLGLSEQGEKMLAYEIDEKTKDAKNAWMAEQAKFEPDFDAVLRTWKAYQSVRLDTIQAALTIKVPNEAWKMLGANVFQETMKYTWSWILRYVLFGWAWLPY